VASPDPAAAPWAAARVSTHPVADADPVAEPAPRFRLAAAEAAATGSRRLLADRRAANSSGQAMAVMADCRGHSDSMGVPVVARSEHSQVGAAVDR